MVALGRGHRMGACLALAGLLFAVSALSAAPQRLEIEAPPELAAEAARLEELRSVELGSFERLLGIASESTPITVVLMPEDAPLARHVPGWIAGFARGDESVVVLFPHRIPSYPHSSLPELVRHEVAHVLIDRASGDAFVPRWFHEGLAMIAEGGWRMADRSRLAIALLRSKRPTPAELDALFQGDRSRAAWAYAVSSAFVRSLVQQHGEPAVSGVLAAMRGGATFDEAFVSTVGATPGQELRDFWRRSVIWYRWLPVITSSSVLWVAVTLLALLAIKRRRERDRELVERWEAEERWAEASAEPNDHEMVN